MATPNRAATPNRSNRFDSEVRSWGAAVTAAWALLMRPRVSTILSGLCQQPLGRVDHLRRLNPEQTSEIARRARPLIARPARQAGDLDGHRARRISAPRRRPRRQRRAV